MQGTLRAQIILTLFVAVVALFVFAPIAHAQFGIYGGQQSNTAPAICNVFGGMFSGIYGRCSQENSAASESNSNTSTNQNGSTNVSGGSIHWSYQTGTDLCPIDSVGVPTCSGAGLTNPFVQINYNTRVVNEETGEVIACGSTVPAGTQLKYEFVPHEYTDIDWFAGTGYFDSPYGDWRDTLDQPDDGKMCKDKNYVGLYTGGGYESGTWKFYSPLVVLPPEKHITGLPDSFGCASLGNGSLSCTPSAEGSFTPVFTFAATKGVFYLGFNRGTPPARADGECDVNSSRGIPLSANHYIGRYGGLRYAWANDGTYYLQVPQQEISCPISVTPPVGEPPVAPTLAILANAQCTVGEPHSITMSATDPDSDGLRYAVDWDANGIVDQYVPGSGFVPSGSLQTVSRTYSIPGSKTVKVKAIDENGLSSNWANTSFTCSGSATASINENDGSDGDDAGGEGDATALLPDLDLRIVPSLVRSGNTTKVNWSSVNVRSCTVTGENGDSWSALQSPLGGNTSKPITGETTYTLTCLTTNGSLTKTATVRIIPRFEEK